MEDYLKKYQELKNNFETFSNMLYNQANNPELDDRTRGIYRNLYLYFVKLTGILPHQITNRVGGV